MVKERSDKSAYDIIKRFEAKPSLSEEHGLSLLRNSDLHIFSPGISTAGIAEIRMAMENPKRKIVATTIDEKGLEFARKTIADSGFENQIVTRLEDVRTKDAFPRNVFDFIYARLILHYLSKADLDNVLKSFNKSLKPGGGLFVVVRSVKNIPQRKDVTFDPTTHLTSIPHYNDGGNLISMESRYFHTPESITKHLTRAGFTVEYLSELQEQLYIDFERTVYSPITDHIIELVASSEK